MSSLPGCPCVEEFSDTKSKIKEILDISFGNESEGFSPTYIFYAAWIGNEASTEVSKLYYIGKTSVVINWYI